MVSRLMHSIACGHLNIGKLEVLHFWKSMLIHSLQMKGPQRTAVFRKECLSYSLFGYTRNLSVPCGQPTSCKAMTMRCRTRYGRTNGRMNRRTISSSYFRQAVNSLCETIRHQSKCIRLSNGVHFLS